MADHWERGLILRVLGGSRAHGLATPESDTDTRGVCIPERRYLLGLSAFEQHVSDDGDHVTWSLAKFVKLALKGNPNIIEVLYTAPEHHLHIDAQGEELLAHRQLFLTRRVGDSFVRYAQQQLGRMERHYRWLTSPPPGQPHPEEFGGRQHRGGYRFPDTAAEKAYRAAMKHWTAYRKWRRDRNPARAALEEAHGYDTKHAMHLCRLLRMGHEILAEGEVRVLRPDAGWLRGVREGRLRYEELIELAEAAVAELPALMEGSPLPDEPNRDAAEALVIRLHEAALAQQGDSPRGNLPGSS